MIENLQGEIWKVIDHPSIGCYPDYMVSNMGRVKSVKFNKERIMKQRKNKSYLMVGLYRRKGEKQKTFSTHRLVALMFLSPSDPDNLLEVNNLQINHRDENPSNNCAENLEFVSARENCNYGSRNQRIQQKRKETIKTSAVWKETMAKVNAKKRKTVYQYTTDLELVNIFASIAKIFQELGYNKAAICDCCNGKRKSHKNFIWSYEPITKVS